MSKVTVYTSSKSDLAGWTLVVRPSGAGHLVGPDGEVRSDQRCTAGAVANLLRSGIWTR